MIYDDSNFWDEMKKVCADVNLEQELSITNINLEALLRP